MDVRRLACISMFLTAAGPIWAQEQQQTDPPSRVARLNYLTGPVSFRPGSQEDWAAATQNYPLTTGDHLWSEPQGGAEMHIGPNALRIAGGTSFSVLNLDDHAVQVSLSQGFMNIRVRRLDDGDTFEVDTPNGAISLVRPGDYRVDVNGDSNLTTVTVRTGSAEMNGGGQAFPISSGQQVRFTGADQLQAESMPLPPPDQWDRWCVTRDQRAERAEAAVERYTGPNMIGSEDLVDYGDWRSDPAYGAYWVPRVAAGWAPYRLGHWAYVVPWGWTWIDDAPWGFAPFHYGRWAMAGGVWGWYPGAVVVRPVYAPALVAFVGGSGFSAAIGIGGVGVAAWVPLGPREVYRPYYRVSDVYVRNVNVTHVRVTNINVTNVTYVNRTYVTAVRQETFVGAHPCGGGMVRVPAGAYGRMERVDVAAYRPAREAYMGRRMEGVRVVAPPRTVVTRTVVVNHAPPVFAGRPAVASYRSAPPVTRRMEFGSQGRYQPAANSGMTQNYGNRNNLGTQQHSSNSPNLHSQPNNARGNFGTQQPPVYGNRGTGNNPQNQRTYGTNNNNATPNYGNRGNTNNPQTQRIYGNPNNTVTPSNNGARSNTGASPQYGNPGGNTHIQERHNVQEHSNVQQHQNVPQHPNVQQQQQQQNVQQTPGGQSHRKP